MTQEENAYNQLLEGIKNYVDKCIADCGKDITFNALVIQAQDGDYKILLNGVEYNHVKTIGGECNINDCVYVLVPQGNYSNMVILK